jgi:hypothetical protein
MTTSISDARIVPLQEDLTAEDLTLQVLRGLDKVHRMDVPYADGVELLPGEWAVLDADGKAKRATATPSPVSYLVFAGTDRYDTRATGKVTLLQGVPLVVKSSRFNTNVSYAVGDYLTVKDLGGGESFLTKAGSTEHRAAKVLEVGQGYLVYETLSN